MSAPKTEETHRKCVKRMIDSKPSVRTAVNWLNWVDPDLHAVELASTIAERHEDAYEHSDNGDILIHNGEIVEVKQIKRYPFWNLDYFRQKFGGNCIIMQTSKFDKREPPPWLVLILNPDMSRLIVINVKETRKHWTKREITDRAPDGDGRTQTDYCIHVDNIQFDGSPVVFSIAPELRSE
jgi:hypothetical protein